jgi:hypothetical protein
VVLRGAARATGVVLVCACVLVAASCGTSVHHLTTKQVVASLHAAGFLSTSVFSNVEATRVATRNNPAIDAKHAADIDSITSPAGRGLTPFPSVLAIRLPSVDAAKQTYSQGYSPSALRAQLAAARRNPKLYSGLLPKGLELSQLRTARVCNVVLSSYDPRHDASLERRFDRALGLLRAACD